VARWSPAFAVAIVFGMTLGERLLEREPVQAEAAVGPTLPRAPAPLLTPAMTPAPPATGLAALSHDRPPVPSGEAQEQAVTVSSPRPSELLASPMVLPSCPGVTVVEWRRDSHVGWTDPDSPGVRDAGNAVIDRACGLALRRYPDFLKSKGFDFTPATLRISVSLLPANTILDGNRPRNMNDGDSRFATVTPHGSDGKHYIIWGVYDMKTGGVFVRNDPVTQGHGENRYFTRIFLHEFGHALSDRWGVQSRYFPGDKNADEKLEEEWTRFAGYGFTNDSSFDDCYRKGLGDAVCIH